REGRLRRRRRGRPRGRRRRRGGVPGARGGRGRVHPALPRRRDAAHRLGAHRGAGGQGPHHRRRGAALMSTSTFDLTGRVALVTGSSRSIGRTLADGLAAAGATVVLNGVDRARLDATRADFAARHGEKRVQAAAFDVTAEDQVVAAVAAIEAEVGPIDVLVNNAGVQHRVPMLDLELADWRRVIDVDLTSAFIVGRAVARGMVERRRGKIVNIGSVQSELARATIAPYTSAKGGLRNLTRAMAAEWGAANVQANSIAP